MPYYLVQAAYSGDAWGAQIASPQNRLEQLRPVITGLGGSFSEAYYSFGEYDIVAIVQFPDNASAAGFSLAASAGGAVRAFKTTPLMTIDEGIEAMSKAGSSRYRPPGGEGCI